ncbi:adaptin protein [Halosimplex salinum]|uniref:adaptin protein n=1 Tax=Halosimplex salinum TaxID=1710538 RepID=UPI0013DDF1BA|nr:adaptin protein [Halosimplex salinum]
MTTILAFDRDDTVDVNPPADREAVPLAWLRAFDDQDAVEVWAIGNQRLRYEAGVPGVPELLAELGDSRVRSRLLAGMMLVEWRLHGYPGLRSMFAAAAPYVDSGMLPTREERLRLLADLRENTTEYVVVDDIDRSHVDGWTHYYPWEFVEAIRAGTLDLDPHC